MITIDNIKNIIKKNNLFINEYLKDNIIIDIEINKYSNADLSPVKNIKKIIEINKTKIKKGFLNFSLTNKNNINKGVNLEIKLPRIFSSPKKLDNL